MSWLGLGGEEAKPPQPLVRRAAGVRACVCAGGRAGVQIEGLPYPSRAPCSLFFGCCWLTFRHSPARTQAPSDLSNDPFVPPPMPSEFMNDGTK